MDTRGKRIEVCQREKCYAPYNKQPVKVYNITGVCKYCIKHDEKLESDIKTFEILDSEKRFDSGEKPKSIYLAPEVQAEKDRTEKRKQEAKEKRDSKSYQKAITNSNNLKSKQGKVKTKTTKEKTVFKSTEDKLDAAIRTLTLIRDSNFADTFCCISCSQVKHIDQSENGHYYRRALRGVRWDLINNNRQCTHCNRTLEGNEIEYRKGLIQKYGIKEIDLLDQRAKKITKYSPGELELMLESLNEQIRLLKKKNKVA